MRAARLFPSLVLVVQAGGSLALLAWLLAAPARGVAAAIEPGTFVASGHASARQPRSDLARDTASDRAFVDPSTDPPATIAGELPPPEGRSAGLRGRLTHGEVGVAGAIAFLDGPNAATRIAVERDGSFLAEELAPGFTTVEVRAEGSTVRREVALRSARTVRLDLDVGGGPTVRGSVITMQGLAVTGARVSLDGNETYTDGMGRFAIAALASGELPILVETDGHAAHRVRLRARAGDVELSAGAVQLVPACRLRIEVTGLPEPRDEAVLVITPGRDQPRTRTGSGPSYPWSRHGAIPIPAGGVLTLDGLPPGSVTVRALHPRATAAPEVAQLNPRLTASAELRATPVADVIGTVVFAGRPFVGARVRLVASNPAKADAVALGTANSARFQQPLGALPSADQTTSTDALGGFVLGWHGEFPRKRAQPRWLVVESVAGEILHAAELRAPPPEALTIVLKSRLGASAQLAHAR